jgi:hypothetical protein
VRAAHLVPAGVVVLVLGGIFGAAQLAGPVPAGAGQPAMPPQHVTVTSAARACPPVQGGGSGQVAFIAGPSASAASGPAGQAALTPVPLAGALLRPVSPISPADPGALWLLNIPAPQNVSKKAATPAVQGWSVTASGTMAQAMEAEMASSSGLASIRCGEPGSDLWFTGPGPQNGVRQIQLDLMNVDSLAASVDVSIITDAGQAQAGNVTGITVPPHQTVSESLSSAAAGSSVVALEVHTTIGRVAANVSETSSHGGSVSWLPSSAPPSTQLVIPGIPPSGSAASLYVVVPGNANARINVVAVTQQGLYHPFGTQTIDLPGDSASYVALTPLGGTPASLKLTANVPVTAAVLVPGSGLGVFTSATAPISEQAVIAGNTTSSGLGATVVLTAPAGAARVRVTEISTTAAGRTGSGSAAEPPVTATQVVSVQAGHTLAVNASPPKGAKGGTPFALVITPLAGSGPVYAARVETQGQNTAVSIIPAVSALTTITLSPVRDSYNAISP